MATITTIRRSESARQFVRFLVVGVANTAISFAAYRLLIAIGTWYALAAPLAFGVGAVNGYLLNRSWTFAARDTTRARVLYVAVQATGAAATTVLVPFFVWIGVDKGLAYLVAIPPVTVCMFVANKLWTFAEPRELAS